MAGSLILLDSITASDDASLTLGTTDWDSSYDVYMVKIFNLTPATNDVDVFMRFTKASDNSVDNSQNYDFAYKTIKTYNAFENDAGQNISKFRITTQEIGTGTSETLNGIMYLFNFNNSSEYSYFTEELVAVDDSEYLHGSQGGGVLTVSQATNGINIFTTSGNIASGTLKLYGLEK